MVEFLCKEGIYASLENLLELGTTKMDKEQYERTLMALQIDANRIEEKIIEMKKLIKILVDDFEK